MPTKTADKQVESKFTEPTDGVKYDNLTLGENVEDY